MKRSLRTVMLSSMVVCLMSSFTSISFAQPGGGGNFDPAEFRAQMLERMQERLEISDDEWKVVGSLVEKVMEKQQAAGPRGGFGFFGGGRRGGQGGPGGDGGGRGGQGGGRRGGFGGFGGEPDPAQTALEEVLEKEDASADDIKAKLVSLRDARKKQEAELKTAREDLRKVLTIRQEATLVLAGMLD